ncbi:hypothetical protein [Ructibacterium gallinarum]|uniref:Uncharacterized protein n=1 Tax=Ructibacterium gallinarum TaxID=2779355 RepID=A0A9D5RA33_9FIRM|nr:hypothetical protein [Ructibacterium gallinarum]MBE5041094.1 hypothetical protein [Ructibacterium gallinarum]
MKEKKSKNVVIIRDIESDTIEQAIFILRGAGSPSALQDSGYRIVTDAQNIIDAYSKTLSSPLSRAQLHKKPSRRLKILFRCLSVFGAVAAFFSVAYLFTNLFSFILEKF